MTWADDAVGRGRAAIVVYGVVFEGSGYAGGTA